MKTRENGGKWSFRYQRDGKNHEMGLGPYPIISISRARYKAQQCLVLLYERKDPLALKHRALENEKSRKSVRFSAVAEDYLDRKPLSELDTTNVLLVLEPLWREKEDNNPCLRVSYEANRVKNGGAASVRITRSADGEILGECFRGEDKLYCFTQRRTATKVVFH